MFERFDYYGAPDIDREMKGLKEAKPQGIWKGRVFQVFPTAPLATIADKPLPKPKKQKGEPVQVKGGSGNFYKALMRTSVMDELKRDFPKLSARDIENAIRTRKASGDVAKIKRRYSELMRKAFKEHIENAITEAKNGGALSARAKKIRGNYELKKTSKGWVAIDKGYGKYGVKEIQGKDKEETIRKARGRWGHFNFDDEAREFDRIFSLSNIRESRDIESEIELLESTDSLFPEIRGRRIEELKEELAEAKKLKTGWVAYPDEIEKVTVIEDPTEFNVKRGNRKDFVTVKGAKYGDVGPVKRSSIFSSKMAASIESDRLRREAMKEGLEEAQRTYKVAQKDILKYLADSGWSVSSGLKVPYATSPDGTLRLWFKSQAVYFTQSDRGRHSASDARTISYDLDIRKASPSAFVSYLHKHYRFE